jgi:circadian clock protein KaiC
VELQIDTIVGEIFHRVGDGRVRRVVIDSMADLANASRDEQRFRDYAYALTQRFSALGVTAMLTMELQHGEAPIAVSAMVDNILLLEVSLRETAERSLRVVKTRGSGYDSRRHGLRISSRGVMVDRRD